MNRDALVEESMKAVKTVYEESDSKSLLYHNWKHTELVYHAVIEIGENTPEITSDQQEMLKLAAIFHDIAYTEGAEDHEEKGAVFAGDFLTERGLEQEHVALVQRLIRATKMGTVATDVVEQVIQDADMAHLANVDYMETAYKDLYAEMSQTTFKGMTWDDWNDKCKEFIADHSYKTKYGQEQLEPGKQANLAKVKAMGPHVENNTVTKEVAKPKAKKNKAKKKGKKEKPDLPEKGIETMFRVTLRNHVNLSRIADNKANTLISVNAIIISIVLTTLFPKLDNNPFLFYPGLVLITACILTIITSILSTIPKTTHGHISKKEVDDKKGNLIFFGNFHKMSLEDYEWSVGELMQDKDYLYKTLTRDLYFLGKVLNRKYTLLRYSYYIFVGGLLVTIAMFVISIQGLQ